jgi:hypothetical protein
LGGRIDEGLSVEIKDAVHSVEKHPGQGPDGTARLRQAGKQRMACPICCTSEIVSVNRRGDTSRYLTIESKSLSWK